MGLEVGDDSGPVGTVGRGIHVATIEERSNGCRIQVENWASFLKLDVFFDVQRSEGLHIADAVMRSEYISLKFGSPAAYSRSRLPRNSLAPAHSDCAFLGWWYQTVRYS